VQIVKVLSVIPEETFTVYERDAKPSTAV